MVPMFYDEGTGCYGSRSTAATKRVVHTKPGVEMVPFSTSIDV